MSDGSERGANDTSGGRGELSAERWRRVAEVLDATLDLAPRQRREAVAAACAGDADLARRVESLLAAEERAGGFLETPAGSLAPELLAELADEAAAEGADDPLVGRRLGPFEVVRLLGAGGMGVVYEARDTRLGRSVALKMLPETWSRDPHARSRLLREARAASALDHPNICALYDLGETDGRVYLVLGYYEGTTLARRLEAGRLPLAEAVSIAVQSARGLRHAHAAGVVHRDVKPANLLLTRTGEVKILDFGIAKMVEATGLTLGMMSPGTPAYMAPEQVRGGQVDERADLWSLGVVLYEMLAGRRPFGGESAQTQIYALLHEDPAPLAELRPEVTTALLAIIERLLAKDPEARYPSASALLAELAPEALGDTAVTVPETPARRAAGAPSRRPWTMVAAVGAAAALLAATLVLLRPSVSPPPAGAAAETAAGPAVPPGATPVELYRAGRELLVRGYRRGASERAAELFRAALEQDSSYAPAHAGLAEAYLWRFGREQDPLLLDRARESADLAVALDPQLATAHVAEGTVLKAQGQADAALREIEQARRLDPRSVEALVAAGSTLLALDRPEEAAVALARAAELAPADWRPWQWRGVLAYRQGDYAGAETAWRRGIERASDFPDVYKNLSAALYKQGRMEEAAAALQEALEIEPIASVYTNLGTLQFYLGRYEAAVASFQRAIELGANQYLTWGNLGDAYRWTQRPERAAEAYRRAIQLVRREVTASPTDATAASRLALYLAKTGETREALGVLGSLTAEAMNDPAVEYRRLVVLELAGDRQAALAALVSTLEAGYPLDEIRREPELGELRSDPRYHLAVAPFEAADSHHGPL